MKKRLVKKMKETEELMSELINDNNVETYFLNNKEDLFNKDQADHLNALLKKYNLTKSEVISNSGLNNKYAYHIFSGVRVPSRDKVISLAFGFKMNLKDTQRLLKFFKYSELYSRDERDCIIILAIENHKNLVDTNIDLDKYNKDIIE